jgi:hypothetical protein
LIRYSTLKEPDLLMNFEKKNSPTYRPIGEMEGRVRETNIFLRVNLSRHIFLVDVVCIGQADNLLIMA